jgi:hypothetical protein
MNVESWRMAARRLELQMRREGGKINVIYYSV